MKRLRFAFSAVFASLLFSACSSAPVKEPSQTSANAPTTATGKTSVLPREAAMIRSRQVHKIRYGLWFGVDSTSNEFQGRTKISFELREFAFQKSDRLRLDFTGGKISALLVNGNAWTAEKIQERQKSDRIEFEKGELAKNGNTIEITYSHSYSDSGNGFYRFKDPEDGKVYLRTDNEPFYANLIFPCFDQPDLKATFEVTVEAPTDWTVISNAPVRDKGIVDGRNSWQFSPSPVMSSYLFALAAGPWKEWKSEYEGIPLALFSRQSLAKYVDAAEWFKITKKGLEFFVEFYGYPYPYAKYDQILIPEMNAGAMENIGAVTFNEKFIFRGPATEEQKRGRAETILHEMAHLWFGDLVTMRWWNGLWLNESFASYMSSLALERTKLFPGAPQDFFSGLKRWAYSEDQLPTTHPVEVSVPDTDQASANFDGITYGKGASALKQFHFLLGDDDFQEGLHRYFTKFANRNTTLADFINTMSQSSDRALNLWTKAWLQSTGYSTLAVDLACEADEKGQSKISKLDIIQKASGKGNVHRPHQFVIGLYYKDAGGHLNRHEEGIRVAFENEKISIDHAIGKKCPDLVFPNEQDYGYFAVELDPKSLETAKTSLPKITDPLTRQMLAYTLREMVKAGNWKMDAFAEAAIEWLKTETNKTILEDLSEMLASQKVQSLSALRVLDGAPRAEIQKKIYTLARHKAETAAPGSDLQRIWFNLALRVLPDADAAEWAMKIYGKKAKISGLKLDPDLRWDILGSVARVQSIDPAVLEAAGKEDPSNEGQTRLLQVRTALAESPLAADLPALFTLQKTAPEIGNAKLRRAMGAYLTLANPKRTEGWRPQFFDTLESVALKSDDSYNKSFVRSLYPSLCQGEVAEETKRWIRSHSQVSKGVRIALEKMAFNEGWCAAIRAGQPYPLWQDDTLNATDSRLGRR